MPAADAGIDRGMSWWVRSNRLSLTAICAGLTALVLAVWIWVPYLRKADLALRDEWTIQFGRFAPLDPRIVYLAIDEPTVTLDQLWDDEIGTSPALTRMQAGFPWGWDVYAMIMERLLGAGADVVVFDMLLPSPREGVEDLKAAFARHPRQVVIGMNLSEVPLHGTIRRSLEEPAEELIPSEAINDPRVGLVNFWVATSTTSSVEPAIA